MATSKNNLQYEAQQNAGTAKYVSDAQAAAKQTVDNMGTNPYATFQESAKTKNAYNYLQNILANRPEDYQSNYGDTITNLLDQIVNRKEFSYDFNADPLYQQYKNQYTQAGKQAMKDTVGQTSAMTGGYGNSYATTAGSQAYQNYLQQLNNKIPELYQQSLNKYQMEGEELRNKYNAVGTQEDREYGQWADNMGFWQNDRNFGLDQYNAFWDQDYREQAFNSDNWLNERSFNYNKYRDLVGDDQTSYSNAYAAAKNAQDYDYGLGRDAVADQRWADEFAYQKERDKVKDQQWAAEYALAKAKAAASGGKGGTASGTAKTATNMKDGKRLSNRELEGSDQYQYLKYMFDNGGDATNAADYLGLMMDYGAITLDEADRLMDMFGVVPDDINWDNTKYGYYFFPENY